MEIELDLNFLLICQEITSEGKTAEEWAEVESDDMFQQGKYSGGFDGTEMEFCFSVHEDAEEYWFQLSLQEIGDVIAGTLRSVEAIPADT